MVLSSFSSRGSTVSPADVGWKLVAVNVSDIAAMGHSPDWATLSISVPKDLPMKWITEFSSGLHEACRKWNISLIGGDTTRSESLIMLSMTMGSRKGSRPIWRSGAQIGDTIWVTGFIGEAAAGFFDSKNNLGLNCLRRPNPPAEFANMIGSAELIHSMIDISDGLYSDLDKLCKASNVGAIIYAESLPKGPALALEEDPLRYMLSFGEDYQLLFTTLETMDSVITQFARRSYTRVTKIGKILRRDLPNGNLQLKGAEWPKQIFSHFDSE